MKVSCSVIKDLMPLSIEELASEDSIQLIKEHINSCEQCKEELEKMKKGQIPTTEKENSDRSLQFVKKNITNKRSKAIAFYSLLVFIAMLTVFTYVISPIYIPYEESGMKIETMEDGRVTVHFSEGITSFRVQEGYWEPNPDADVKEIVVWTSLWDRYLKKSSAQVTLSADTDMIIFDDYAKHGEMKVAYTKENVSNYGNGIILKRNVLKAYLLFAGILTFVLALFCLMVRRQRSIFQVAWKIFLIPVSYIVSSLLLFRDLSFYETAVPFCMIVLCSGAIYGCILLGGDLIKNR